MLFGRMGNGKNDGNLGGICGFSTLGEGMVENFIETNQEMENGKWETKLSCLVVVGNEKWEMGNGKWEIGNGKSNSLVGLL